MSTPTTRLHTLVADPDPGSAATIREALLAEGHRVDVVPDPGRLVDELRRAPAHVVVVDLPPAPDEGLRLLRQLHAVDSDLCTIAITGSPNVDTAIAAMKGHASEYLPKPVEPEVLRRAVREAAEEKGLLVDLERRLNAEVGRRVRARRQASRLTLKQVARRTGLSISLLSQVELGKSAASLSTLYKLARALRVPMTYFLETV